VIQQEPQNDQLTSLRRQVKILGGALTALAFIVLILLLRAIGGKSSRDPAWPDMAAGNLQVKRVTLMSDSGKQVAVLSTIEGRPRFALLDPAGEIRLVLSEREDGGHISFWGDKEGRDTELKNGEILIGNDKAGGISIEGPPLSMSRIEVLDNSGFSTRIGQTYRFNSADGTASLTSGATIVGSSKDSTSTWSLINQPSALPATLSNGANKVPGDNGKGKK
jgi:hypothetical protein